VNIEIHLLLRYDYPYKGEGGKMYNTKAEVKELLNRLPDDCTIEDIQYHLYVVGKINKGIGRAKNEGMLSRKEVERKFARWNSQ
jgi:hypothetical protein